MADKEPLAALRGRPLLRRWRTRVESTVRGLRVRALAARSFVDRSLVADGEVHWLFIVNFPNGGSTAFANLLLTAEHTVALTDRAEGQWLIPSLSRPVERWNPAHEISPRTLRAVWLHEARRRGGPGELLVVEKSPPNMCRLDAILDAFGAMPTTVVTMARDPYATCASWHERYGAEAMARRTWGDRVPADSSGSEYVGALAGIWLERARMLLAAREVSAVDLTYEQVCSDPSAALREVAAAIPALATADATSSVVVKDYPPQPIVDMNARQIAGLTAEQRNAIATELGRDADVVERLGYAVAPPT